MISPMLKRAAMAASVAAMLGLAACATPSRPEAMAVPMTAALSVSAGQTGYHSVTTVTVNGGSDTNPLLVAQVSDADLKTALETSLAAAGYMGSEGQAMSVNASLIDLQQPMVGLDMTVTSRVRYTVMRNGQPIFDETIAATGTATVSEAFAATDRIRLANEKSIQGNITQFLTQLRSRLR